MAPLNVQYSTLHLIYKCYISKSVALPSLKSDDKCLISFLVIGVKKMESKILPFKYESGATSECGSFLA